ncbi:1-pyrroline-5-carboxylate dehydrogenase [Zafaria cholistanensis]|uniref:L-glutamate gamma-semialdehyde dehydrogenase n=1 Tax=Zafaria cholistanensis TaxID=1682741 RepID=A0A5A7NQC6_9MICC|nr:1-pyrroline-5-carboxylate dehydrogenase [Zafaria cholistanensis]
MAGDAVQLARRWVAEAATVPVDASAARLAGVLRDPKGLAFTVGFVDGVVRPEDLSVAARNLRALAPDVPAFLPWPLRRTVALGGLLAPVLPGVVVPVARRVLRRMVGHLVVDATDARLGAGLARVRREGVRLNVNLLGEAILGEAEAARRLEGTRRLLARDDVDYVSIKVSSTTAPHSRWAFEEAVETVADRLLPLYRLAAGSARRKFINLDMEEYKDLELTIAVFTRLLERPELHRLKAGIALQAYLPDALSVMARLQEWAAARTGNGGAPIKVRVVKGANLPMETVDADLHGWPLATWGSKQETDTSYKAVLDYALEPDRTANVRIGVAGHNLFDIALAWLLAKARGVTDGIEFEMLLGMATGQAEAVRREVGSLLLYTPVVHPGEFDVAIAYLIRRLEEGASQENFMSAVFELGSDPSLFEREKDRFLASLAALTDRVPAPHRTQDRDREHRRYEDAAAEAARRAAGTGPVQGGGQGGGRAVGQRPGEGTGTAPAGPAGRTDFVSPATYFANTPDTDPDLPGNRAWGRAILRRVPTSTLGLASASSRVIGTEAALEAAVSAGVEHGTAWGALPATTRAAVLHLAGDRLEAHRADLLEVMAAECGKTLDQGDPEVSEAIDFAHHYAELARELEMVDGARFIPSKLTAVVPPWNFPVAIPAGSTLAALAAGSGVLLKPATPARRTGAVLAEALWEAFEEAGVDRSVLQYIQLGDRRLGRRLIAHPAVDRVILTGGHETAELFRSFRPDLPLLGETSGKNAIIVTPSADLDLAARDVATSAFGHAGQKCSAASLVVLVGSAARSRRFRDQLVDAVRSLHVGYPWDPRTRMGPVIEPARGKLLRGLTVLGEGEHWVLEPRPLDASGKLWSPGIRAGVQPGSEFHRIEYFGPVLGVMAAETLEEAVAVANGTDYGLTSGLHSLDRDEVAYWLEHIQAGNLYVNRGITGAIVHRQPFGGWKKSAVGPGAKAGGPNYLIGLGAWEDAPAPGGAPGRDSASGQGGTSGQDSASGQDGALEQGRAVDQDRPAGSGPAAALHAAARASVAGPSPARISPARISTTRTSATRTSPTQSGGEAQLSSADVAWLGQALASDALAWNRLFGPARDVSGLRAERNVLRYRPVPVTVRFHSATSGHGIAELVRVLAAGLTAGSLPVASTAVVLPEPVRHALTAAGVAVHVEDDAAWLDRAAALAARNGPEPGLRLRLIGADPAATARAVGGSPDVAIHAGAVVSSGRVELLPFLREQAVSITAHRFGTPHGLADGLL